MYSIFDCFSLDLPTRIKGLSVAADKSLELIYIHHK